MATRDIADQKAVRDCIARALQEDIGHGDVTTLALVDRRLVVDAIILARDNYTVSGNSVAAAVFRALDRSFRYEVVAGDGRRVARGKVIARLRGKARAMLTGERTALNFMQRMTGIATLTGKFVRRTKRYGVRILDTRKTTPGLRLIEKYAVLCGGGTNHRMGLHDMILIKDNHRALWKRGRCAGLDKAVDAARKRFPGVPLEIEVESLAELRSALRGAPDWVLLDNMRPAAMRQCVRLCAGKCRTEASGGINMSNIVAAARTGVDAISLGCLTHSARAADLSLEIC
ncbi:MAG: nicotinate-nucleotide diphosphorylase (carboxylating) [Verrucomicrobia bacterium]|nr:nicotinate-nucleotide diphosphorylase (carboxylating) [Verrucomicrobiota bacterium]